MERTAPAPRAFTATFVASTLAGILLLALVLPYWAVSTLHARRLAKADGDLARIAAELSGTRDRPGEILVGAGDRPRAADPRWEATSAAPLMSDGARTHPDPWGNAYIAIVNGDGQPSWVLSAGPDGILQTSASGAGIASPQGDDRGTLVGRGSPPK